MKWRQSRGSQLSQQRCKVRRVGVVLIFPEDFGGHVKDGPASPWSSREFQELECACDVRRGSAFLCQLASTDQRRPVGILKNLPTLQGRLSLHWPILERCGDELIYVRPTPRIMSVCSTTCSVQVERTQRSTFRLLSSKRRAQCSGKFVWPTSVRIDSFFSLWDGGSIPSQDNGDFNHTCLILLVISLQGSTCILSGWNGSLSRALLRDFGSPGQVDRVFLCKFLVSLLPWWSSSSPASRHWAWCCLRPCRSPRRYPGARPAQPLVSVSQFLTGTLEFSPTALSMPTSESSPVSSRSLLQSSLPLDTGSSARQPWSQVTLPFFSLRLHRDSHLVLRKLPLVRMRPRGYTPHGYSGVDVGSRVTGASDGSVRTRLRYVFSVCSLCQGVCLLITPGIGAN